ncbi:MAG: metalloregulator ArsR/SmtB family transcription factor [Atribacterota bacterium]|nr:metalloregulator ArsR/SmtB family transcription factor [Candidatus Atribacteria bacterium]
MINPSGNFCEIFCSDQEKVQRVKSTITTVAGIFDIFKVLADDTRLKIVYGLLQEELCVCDLANILDMTPPAVSHHLKILRMSRLVKHRREGKMAFYSLDDEHIACLIENALLHCQELLSRK